MPLHIGVQGVPRKTKNIEPKEWKNTTMSNISSSGREFVFPILMQGAVVEKGNGRVVLPHRATGKVIARGKLRFGAGGIVFRLKKTLPLQQVIKTAGKILVSTRMPNR